MISLNLKKYNRWQASASHLAISLVIFLVILSIIVFIWYPGDLIHAGGWQGIKIVAGVDLILGPLLTLIIYNPTKKSLPFDLAIIGILQISALSYGGWSIYNERPYVLALSHDGVHIIKRADLIGYKLYDELLDHFPQKKPLNVYMDLPDDDREIANISLTTEMIELKPLVTRVDLYKTYPIIEETDLYQRKFYKAKNQDCHIVNIISPHTSGNACINFKTGKFRLKK